MSKILMIEDDIMLAQMYQRKLEENGLSVKLAYSGTEGLAEAQMEKPDLILLDIMMPKMNGFDVLKRLKENIILKEIPVIVLTALTQDSDREESKKLGAVDYLIKSDFTPGQIIDKIQKYLK
ncbi:TPA: response regulator [Candidatus Berkelbacteria bacterium]|uniref:Response regulatory domain-containing protein n=1 Tax=Berkelbacteria bacterium GW2011_GWE1_39_12 TaxID=1618337 RepID=A0A0G4B436_9BACT|nr:MAG: hypothetical protein UT28_C0001G0530 [Berkelbacteria bacterium GW2011_GWE1_39_12]HBO60926.1 response regulator [Candidatus Berkelbacteria bacterium]